MLTDSKSICRQVLVTTSPFVHGRRVSKISLTSCLLTPFASILIKVLKHAAWEHWAALFIKPHCRCALITTESCSNIAIITFLPSRGLSRVFPPFPVSVKELIIRRKKQISSVTSSNRERCQDRTQNELVKRKAFVRDEEAQSKAH